MFDVGWSELILLAVLGLLVVGPRELPRLLRRLGRFWQRMRATAFSLRQNLSLMDEGLDETPPPPPIEERPAPRTAVPRARSASSTRPKKRTTARAARPKR